MTIRTIRLSVMPSSPRVTENRARLRLQQCGRHTPCPWRSRNHVDIDPKLAIAGLLVGLLVGATGMGGGAILTPLLVLGFGVPPLAAVSSDLLTSLVIKPVAAVVHLRKRTVNLGLVAWLSVGAVPAGFVGAMIIGLLNQSEGLEDGLKIGIGIALVASLAASLGRQIRDRRNTTSAEGPAPHLPVRPLRTVLIGVVGGLAVGMTSVGAGSLIIAALLLAYPRLRPGQLVGTDIVQAIPLVAAATVGHLFFGDVQLSLTAALLIGALPGVYLGAQLSAKAPAGLIRPLIAGVLAGSSLALLGAPGMVVPVGSLAAAALSTVLARGPARLRSTRAPARTR